MQHNRPLPSLQSLFFSDATRLQINGTFILFTVDVGLMYIPLSSSSLNEIQALRLTELIY